MTRSKGEILDRIKKNVPTIWEEYPYSAGTIVIGSILLWELLKFGIGVMF